jgi:hypothetical protein
LRPLRVQNFAESRAGQDEQADGRDGVRVEFDAAVFWLRGVLRFVLVSSMA